jgi:hypothetical protein
MGTKAIAAAGVGAAIGVGAWAGLAAAVDFPTGFCALAVGGLAGFASKRAGGQGTKVAGAAALLALLGAFTGFGFAARAKVEAGVRNELASVDRAHYDAFAAAAADWKPTYSGDETAKFAKRHEFVQFGAGVDARLAEFRRNVVPKLEAWRKSAPTFEAWKASREEEIRAGAASPWKTYLASPLDYVSPLDMLFALVAAGGAGWIANVPEPVKIVRRGRRESGPEPSAPG